MDYKKIKTQIQSAKEQKDTAALAELATGLLAGREAADEKLHRMVEISRPAVGMEDEWDHTIRAITG